MRRDLAGAVSARLDPLGRYGLRLTLFGVAVVLVGIPFGLLLEQVTNEGRLTRLDSSLARSLNGWVADRPLAIDALDVVSFLGKPIWLFVVVGLSVLWLMRNGDHKLVTFLVVTSLGGSLVDTIVKIVVARPRPIVDNPVATAMGKSFPSGHAMSSTVCYGALVLVFIPVMARRWRRWSVALVAVLVALIGMSRLALGVHFLSDVLGGFVLGSAWLIASVAAFQTWRVERGRRRSHPIDEGVEPEELNEPR